MPRSRKRLLIVPLASLLAVAAGVYWQARTAREAEFRGLVERNGLELANGIRAYNDGDYEDAKRILVPLAEAGNGRARNFVGLMHDYGYGFPKDEKTACDWYEKAGQVGDFDELFNIATCCSVGIGRDQDVDRAIVIFSDLTKVGGEIAQDAKVKLAYAYETKGDMDNYFRWMESAAEDGDKLAQYHLVVAGRREKAPDFGLLDFACIELGARLGVRSNHCD